MTMTVKFFPNDRMHPAGKLADAELFFPDGPLAGLKLVGFAVWAPSHKGGRRTVTFPARSYTVGGERRSFSLLRPIVEIAAQEQLRDWILAAFVEFESELAAEAM